MPYKRYLTTLTRQLATAPKTGQQPAFRASAIHTVDYITSTIRCTVNTIPYGKINTICLPLNYEISFSLSLNKSISLKYALPLTLPLSDNIPVIEKNV